MLLIVPLAEAQGERQKYDTLFNFQDPARERRKEIVKLLALLSLAAFLSQGLGATQAHAGSPVRLLPGGVAFPEYNSEGTTNPGTLGGEEARVVRLLLVPNIFGSSVQGLGLDHTYTKERYGFDVGYNGYRTVYTGLPASDLAHAFYGAAGYRTESVGFGLSYTHSLLPESDPALVTTETQPAGELDFGLAYSSGQVRIALVVENIISSPTATLGAGIHEKNKHAVEFNLRLPPLSTGPTGAGATYDAILALSLYLDTVGFGYTTQYSYSVAGAAGTVGTTAPTFLDTPLGFSHAFSLLARISPSGSLSARFNSNDYLTIGLTFGL